MNERSATTRSGVNGRSPGRRFRTLIRSVQNGSREAAERLCRDYQSHILRVVRRRLMKRMRVRYDSLDLVHDVWLSFFAQPPKHHRFDSPDALIAYLERMTKNKVAEATQHAWRAKHSPDREVYVEALEDYPSRPGRQPTPSQIVAAKDEFERMLVGRPLYQKRILTLLHQGLSHQEIADKLQTNTKTVQRLIRRLTVDSTTHE